VMAERGREILAESYRVDSAKVRVIPHGVPDCALTDSANARRSIGLDERPTVLTFGLLAPDKGIEDAIEAMATIRETVPDVHYIVLGATHPHLLRGDTDVYRTALLERTVALGLQDNVTFLDRFVALEELTIWLAAADVYVTPYRNPAQITSGTLSYAVGLGKAVVSTPYVHANEILADNHGVIVPFRSPSALAEAIGELLTDESARTDLSARAYERGRSMIWSRNGEAVLETLSTAVYARVSPRAVITPFGAQVGPIERMTDDTGMFQHSIFGIPDRRHGYCIDDNARGLLLMALADDLPRATRIRLSNIYASFVQYAWNPDARCFRNFMGYDRNWCEAAGSEDSNGRTLWALGIAAAHAPSTALRHWAASLYDQASSMLEPLMSPRARAFAMLGAASMARIRPGDVELERTMREGGAMLTGLLVASRRPDWSWFEVVLSYDNTRLSEALIRAGMALNDKMMATVGLDTLEWIACQTTGHDGQFQPIGTASFGQPFAAPAVFDQQPLEAWAMIDACAAAQAAVPDARWVERAAAAYRWFLGDNALSLSLVDLESGECGDGLTPFEVNLNNGAESVIAWQAACRGFSALARHEKDADALEAA
jgi:Glycosyl transferases group 1